MELLVAQFDPAGAAGRDFGEGEGLIMRTGTSFEARTPAQKALKAAIASTKKKPPPRTEAQKQIAKAEARARRDKWEVPLLNSIKAMHLPVPQRNFRFHPTRGWQLDLAWPHIRVAVEIDGGENMRQGQHNNGESFVNDREKHNAALMEGWRVLRFAGSQVKDGTAIATIIIALEKWG